MTDATPSAPLLRIDNLGVTFPLRSGNVEAVRDASLEIRQGEIVAVVGESGSGKTMIARSILRLLPPPAIISAGRILFEGHDMAGLPEREMRRIRGAGIGMIFQEPLVSLNPALRIGPQMFEAMQLHTGETRQKVRARAIELLKAVRIPDPEGCLRRFPHEFSGGMRQRIMIASVMMLKPRLLLADEPTTALDAIVQKDVLDTMQGLVRDLGTAVMLVSHDLGLVSRYADRIVVMEKGVIVEQGDTATVLSRPEHPYTRKLLSSLPSPGIDGLKPDDGDAAAPDEPLLQVSDLRVDYATPRFLPFQPPKLNHAVAGVSFDLRKGEMLGLVGESGSGKSTLGRAILRLVDASGGDVRFDGQDTLALKGEALRRLRTKMQMIFQDPYSSLDPRSKVRAAVAEGLRHVPGLSRRERDDRTMEMLEAVGLGTDFAGRFPHELSGGQRQRVAIARALVSRPLLVVADEPVSALDVTIQAQILDLLRDLKDRLGFSCLFISHDLGVVEAICDRVIVLYKGRIMEEARADRLFARPAHPYTCALMNAVPVLASTAQGYRVRDIDCKPPELPDDLGQFFDSERHGSDHRLRDISDQHRVAFGASPGSPRS